MLHFGEFFATGNAQAEIFEIIAAVSMQYEAMMPVIHAQVTPITFALLRQFEADHRGSKMFPRIEILYPDAHVAEFCDLYHGVLLKRLMWLVTSLVLYRFSCFSHHSAPSATRRTASVSVG